MVFNSVSETETPLLTPPSMASTFSAKSQPLHNFPLSNLKWSMNQPNSQRLRRLSDPTHYSHSRGSESPLNNDGGGLDHHLRSPLKDGYSGQNPELLLQPSPVSPLKSEHRIVKELQPAENSSGSGHSDPVSDGGIEKSGFTVPPAAAENPMEKEEKSVAVNSIESSEKKVAGTARGVGKMKGFDGKSKICVRFPGKNKGPINVPDAARDEALFAFEDDEPIVKTWNLRPRKPIKPPNGNGGAHKLGGVNKNGGALMQESKLKNQPDMAPVRAPATGEKAGQKRAKFSVSLSKEDVEKDFLIMTGLKPPKKPKKRSRAVQKQLDVGFPGLYLGSVTPDLYKVPDPPLKA